MIVNAILPGFFSLKPIEYPLHIIIGSALALGYNSLWGREMPEQAQLSQFIVGDWTVTPSLDRLERNGKTVNIEPRAMAVLVYLAQHPGQVVSTEEITVAVWQGRAVGNDAVYQRIYALRAVFKDDAHSARYIETIPTKGYRLIAAIEFPDDGITGVQFNKRRVTVASALVLVAAFLGISYLLSQQSNNAVSPFMTAPQVTEAKSIAVLPFVDMSEDGSQQYFSDGISDELIHVLSNLPDLRVTARTSSFAFRDTDEDIRQIGDKLNVATILVGNVRRDGNRIRVTSQLVDTRNGYHLWSQSFDRESSDIFGIQNEIAVAVAQAFEFRDLDTLSTDDIATRSDDLQAYEFYLLAMHHLHKEIRSSYVLAIKYFERAIETDPDFARAHAGLSEGYGNLFWYDGDQELLDKSESKATYALRLDDQSAEAYRALGITKYMREDYTGANTDFTIAIELNPNDALAYSWFIYSYKQQEKHDEALKLVQDALRINPMSGILNTQMGDYLYRSTGGDWDAAFIYFNRAIERDPDYSASYVHVSEYFYSTGQLDQALPYARKRVNLTTGSEVSDWGTDLLTGIYVDLGDYDSAAKLIHRIRETERIGLGVDNSEIHLLLARGEFSAAREIVHNSLAKEFGHSLVISLLAFYEMVIGDTGHAEEIYTHLAARAESTNASDEVTLYTSNELSWGMLGAVNLAHLRSRNGDILAAQELLRKAREYIETQRDDPLYFYSSSIPYVFAQIAAIEGDNEAAIRYFRNAVDAGWVRAWFGRIDPIMVDLRKDPRFIEILEELEGKMLEMREHSNLLTLN